MGITVLQYTAPRRKPLTSQEEMVLKMALLGQGVLGGLAAQLSETPEERRTVMMIVTLAPPTYVFSAALCNILERFTFFAL